MARARTRTLLLLVGVATVAVYVGVFLLATTDDRQDQFDDETVRSAVSTACAALRADVDALPLLPERASQVERRARVQEQDRLLGRFLALVRAVGPALESDAPGPQWLADWESLAAARRAWPGTGGFAPPAADGRPITQRMEAVDLDACRVPIALTTAP